MNVTERVIQNGAAPEWATLLTWMEKHPSSAARLRMPGRCHVGYLTAQTTVGHGTARTWIRVRDSRRGSRSQYQTPRYISDLEIKVAGRYRPATDVINDGC